MRKQLSAFGLGIALTLSAYSFASADGLYSKSVKDAPMAPPCCETNWTGFYVSGSVGYGIASSEVDYRTVLGAAAQRQRNDVSGDDVIGSVGGGYDKQLGSLVLGVFGDYTFGDLNGSSTLVAVNGGFTDAYRLRLEDAWAVGGRIGLSKDCCTLWFLTAGYTEADLRMATASGERYGKTLSGYFVGGGVEQKLKGGFSLKLEYRYSDFDEVTLFRETTGTCCSSRIDADSDVHSIRIGLVYKLGAEEGYAPYK